MKTFVTQGELS